MPSYTNAAYRLEHILRMAAEFPDRTSIVETWTQVFNIEFPDAHDTSFEVARMVGLLNGQVQEVQSQMDETPTRPERYTPYLSNVSKALDIQQLGSQWQERKRFLDQTTLNAIGWCADTIPKAEEAIDDETLLQLVSDLNGFHTVVAGGFLPDYVKVFVFSQIDNIYRAAREYPVVGAEAFRSATVQTFFDTLENKDIYEQYSDTEEMGKFRELLWRIQGFAEKAGPWIAIGRAFGQLIGGNGDDGGK